MAESKEDILGEFGFVMGFHGLTKSTKWYAGITSDPRKRLFSDHGVKEDSSDEWCFKEAYSEKEAREIEKSLHDSGLEGSPGGGDANSKFVYIYLIRSHTVQ